MNTLRSIAIVIALALGGIVVAAAVYACATIMHGSSQEVGIGSTPTGAKVSVDGREYGKTPTVAKLSRKDHHTVRIEMEGYEPYEMTLVRKTSGWVWGNIVFGGLIGLAVDAISGGLYKIEPAQVQATLAGRSGELDLDDDALYFAVVLRPDPEWQRIGKLLATPAREPSE